jgi:quinol monooxygenase YgiN
MIHVIATIQCAKGRREEYLAIFRRLVPVVHGEPGCLEYGPTIDVPAGLDVQVPLRPDVATIVEKWASVEALHAHQATPHMLEYRVKVKDLVESVQIQILLPT